MRRLLTMLILMPMLSSCGQLFGVSAKSIEGYVIDGRTKHPLEGVIVIVAWPLEAGTHQSGGYLVLDEAMTDSNGYYYLAGWKGKRIPMFTWLSGKAPTLEYFKFGYWLRSEINGDPREPDPPLHSPRESLWNGKIIELNPYEGDQLGKYRALSRISGYYTDAPYCMSQRLPILTLEIARLSKSFSTLGSNHSSGLPVVYPGYAGKCRE